jgi:hypothetical protein
MHGESSLQMMLFCISERRLTSTTLLMIVPVEESRGIVGRLSKVTLIDPGVLIVP